MLTHTTRKADVECECVVMSPKMSKIFQTIGLVTFRKTNKKILNSQFFENAASKLKFLKKYSKDLFDCYPSNKSTCAISIIPNCHVISTEDDLTLITGESFDSLLSVKVKCDPNNVLFYEK